MGWPRKDDVRVYFEKKDKTYILVYVGDGLNCECYSAIGATVSNFVSSLGNVGASPNYLRNKCKRVAWDDVPENWRNGLKTWLDKSPEEYRGLWRIGQNG